jgi:hypothetical protein
MVLSPFGSTRYGDIRGFFGISLGASKTRRSDMRLPRSLRQYPFDPNDELAGDIGAAFAAGANVGLAINAASARAAISTFMTRLHLWTVVLIWTSAPIGRRLRTNMPSPGLSACDADHSLQNDSERFRTFRFGPPAQKR